MEKTMVQPKHHTFFISTLDEPNKTLKIIRVFSHVSWSCHSWGSQDSLLSKIMPRNLTVGANGT